MMTLKNVSGDNKSRWIIEICTFTFLLVFQIILNKNEIVPRSLPDEIGAMAVAAKLGGYDWSYLLSKAGLYYGFGTTFLLFPVFYFIKDPLIIYQVFLAWGALLRTIPVFFCFSISKKALDLKNNYLIALISMISVIGAPTRATNIDNEPMLILIAWSLFYLLILLQNPITLKAKNCYSVIYALVLGFSLTIHTRAYIYFAVSILLFIVYHLYKKNALINYRLFAGTYVVIFLIGNLLKIFVQNNVYTSEIYISEVLNNTAAAVSSKLLDKITNIFLTKDGFLSAFVLLMSNTWIVCVFSAGLIILTILMVSYTLFNDKSRKKLRKDRLEILIFPSLFAISIFLISIGGLSVLWISGPIEVWEKGAELTRGFFYLRYIGNSFGPILFVGCVLMCYLETPKRFYAFILFLQIFAATFVINSVISMSVNNNKTQGDWFGYFAPLTLERVQWKTYIQDVKYYLTPTLISCLIICVVYYANKYKKQLFSLLLILFLFVYQYTYSVVNWDNPFSHSDNYYGAVDGTYALRMSNEIFFSDIDSIYYCDDVYGRQFIMQLILYDKELITDYPKEKQDNMLIIFTDYEDFISNISFDLSDFYICKMDSNEFIATNNEQKRTALINREYPQVQQ